MMYPVTNTFDTPRFVPKDPLSPALKCLKLFKIHAPNFLEGESLENFYTFYGKVNYSKKAYGASEVGNHLKKAYKKAQKIDSLVTTYEFLNSLSTCSGTLGFFDAKFLLVSSLIGDPLSLIKFAESATEYQFGKIKNTQEKWELVAKRVVVLVGTLALLSFQFQLTIGTFNTALGVVKYCLDESIRYNKFCQKWS